MSDDGRATWLRPAAICLALAAIVLVPVNAVLVVRNQGTQRELSQLQLQLNQGAQLARESKNLRAIVKSQDTPIEEATRLKQATDSLAGDIGELAQQGDANAEQVVDELARQNVQLRPGVPVQPPK